MTAAEPTLYTIGHSTRTADDFIELLDSFGVRRVADVRAFPRSRRNPQFEALALARTLAHRGIEYRHFPDLGGFRHTRPDSTNTALRNASFRGYADYMQTQKFADAVDSLIGWAARDPTAIMCAEALPWRCHRYLISDALVVRGVHVEHIIGVGEAMAHSLNPLAVVEGEAIVYSGS